MSKHTPGPWYTGVGEIWGRKVVGVANTPTKVIAACGEAGAHDEEESIANAALIAAAPDLLEALEIAMEYLPHINADWATNARAAIAKATNSIKKGGQDE